MPDSTAIRTAARTRARLSARYGSHRSANDIHDEQLTPNERLALWLTIHVVGVMGCFYVLIVFYGGWMLTNQLLATNAFDAYPFALLLFISNALQLFWLPILSVGQNVLARHAEIRAEQDHERFLRMDAKLDQLIAHR